MDTPTIGARLLDLATEQLIDEGSRDSQSPAIAAVFCAMSDEGQATFFEHVAAIMGGWGSFQRDMQIEFIAGHLRTCECVTDRRTRVHQRHRRATRAHPDHSGGCMNTTSTGFVHVEPLPDSPPATITVTPNDGNATWINAAPATSIPPSPFPNDPLYRYERGLGWVCGDCISHDSGSCDTHAARRAGMCRTCWIGHGQWGEPCGTNCDCHNELTRGRVGAAGAHIPGTQGSPPCPVTSLTEAPSLPAAPPVVAGGAAGLFRDLVGDNAAAHQEDREDRYQMLACEVVASSRGLLAGYVGAMSEATSFRLNGLDLPYGAERALLLRDATEIEESILEGFRVGLRNMGDTDEQFSLGAEMLHRAGARNDTITHLAWLLILDADLSGKHPADVAVQMFDAWDAGRRARLHKAVA